MKTNTWGMLTFIHTGAYYGFTHDTLRQELHIPINLYNDLKEEVEKILQADYPDQPLRNKVLTKSGLVMNCVRAWYRI